MSAQIASALQKDYGSLDDLVSRGDFAEINGWLREHIFQHGARYTTRELLKRATGETLKSDYYKDYLREKFSVIYGVLL